MLTEKELQVLRRRAEGESQLHIAQALNISQPAVSKFEKSAQRKILEAQRVLELGRKLGVGIEMGEAGPHVTYSKARKRGGSP